MHVVYISGSRRLAWKKSDLGVWVSRHLPDKTAPPLLRTYILAADFDSDGHPTRPAPVLEFAPDTEVSQIFQLLGPVG